MQDSAIKINVKNDSEQQLVLPMTPMSPNAVYSHIQCDMQWSYHVTLPPQGMTCSPAQ